MAINIISGNLNQLGDAGNYETDRSTWGFGVAPTTQRSPTWPHKGLNSALVQAKFQFITYPESAFLSRGRFNAVAGKTYLAYIWVLTPLANPIAPNLCSYQLIPQGDVTVSYDLPINVGDTLDTYQKVEIRLQVNSTSGTEDIELNINRYLPGDQITWLGYVSFDEFEIYEYEDVPDVCTLLMDTPTTIDETMAGANNGQVRGFESLGVAPFEWQVVGLYGWQASKIFNNIPPGNYTLQVREQATPTCIASVAFTILAAPLFGYGIVKTDLTAPASNDGTITITVTGAGAPFAFSKDNGASWQSPGGLVQVYNALLPGNYPVLIRDIAGHVQGQNVTIAEGAYAFDFTLTPTAETTEDANDGTITVAVTGVVAPFTKSIDGGFTFQSGDVFAALAPGLFTIIVKDAGGILRAKSVTIVAGLSSFAFSVAKTNETIYGANDGTITLAGSGSGSPYEYSIDNGDNYFASGEFTNLAPGTYSVKVKNSYDVELGASIVIATAIITFDKSWLSKNPVIFGKAVESPNWETLDNVQLYDDVIVEDITGSNTFTSKLKVAIPPDEAGKVVFQIRQAFANVLTATPPTLNQTGIVRLTDRIKYFKHYHGELQDQEVVPSALSLSLPHLVMLGGLSKEALPDMDFFGDYLTTNKNFMTWAPPVKQVDRLQEEYLNFFCFDPTFAQLKVSVKAYYDDNTNQTSTVVTQSNVKHGHLYQIGAGPANSGVAGINPAKTLIKYELSLLNQANSLISEVRTYILNPIRYPNTRLFMFLNSVGTYEVMPFYGAAQINNSFERELVKKYLPVGYAALAGEKAVNNIIRKKKGNYSSGYFTGDNSAAWLDYMNDFMLSEQVYDITDGKRRPVIITDGNVESEDQNYKRFFRFTAEDAYDNNVYTP